MPRGHMERQEIQDLIKKYNAGACSDYEKALVEDWYLQFEMPEAIALTDEQRAADLDYIKSQLPVGKSKIRSVNRWYRVAAAAVVILSLGIGIRYYTNHKTVGQEQVIATLSHNLKPGGNKAILTLSNGKQIVLNDAVNGNLTSENNTAVIKSANGEVVYKTASTARNSKVSYNTMSTPVGGTYKLTLADGTNVFLDAASSIKYPVAFVGNERRVEITGQAYFEVAHNKQKPFKVTTKGQTVEVLGTHFNVNAYNDEEVTRTTLLEGSVKVSNGGKVALLRPGQQSIIAVNKAAITVSDADLETAVAWKDGVFSFKRADLKTVMRQFARWYDVEVIYENGIPNAAITGKVSRTANAAQILKIITSLGIKFKMDGKKISILNPD